MCINLSAGERVPRVGMIVQTFKFSNERERERAMAQAQLAASAYASKTGVKYTWRLKGIDAYVVERWDGPPATGVG